MIGTLSHCALQEEQMDAPDLPEQVYAEVLAGSARLRRTFPFRLCVEQIR